MKFWHDPSFTHRIAHRGASTYAPENSVAAIHQAAIHGATAVEVDLHTTQDGAFIITHDATVEIAGTPHWISTLTLNELEQQRPHNIDFVALDELLATVNNEQLGLYLDIKQLLPGTENALLKALADHDLVDQTVCASFHSDVLYRIRNISQIDTSLLFYDQGLDLNALTQSVNCQFVHPCFDLFPDPVDMLTAAWLDQVARTGARIITWNTLSVSDATALMRLGVAGICSDDPAVLVQAASQLQSLDYTNDQSTGR